MHEPLTVAPGPPQTGSLGAAHAQQKWPLTRLHARVDHLGNAIAVTVPGRGRLAAHVFPLHERIAHRPSGLCRRYEEVTLSTTNQIQGRQSVPSVSSRASRVRWFIAIACAIGLAINYIDRSAISVALPFMSEDLSLSPAQQGLVLSAFSWSYALMQIPAGRLIDRFGERLMFGASVLVWSVFTGLTAVASSFGVLMGLRLGLGVGEAGAYPSSAKTVSRWFPQ